MKKKILLYGANGFTARLMLDKIKTLPCEIIIAGRNRETLTALSKTYGLDARVFSLDDGSTIEDNISDIGLVINCAGPFSKTALPLARACIKSTAHYFDITGELNVFTGLFALNRKAKAKNVCIIPGMGFDIVPSECLSKMLAERMTKPSALTLAIVTRNTRPSHGTLKTALLEAGLSAVARRKEGLISAPKGAFTRAFTINNRSITCIRAPLADLFCANLSTGITTIDTYLALPKQFVHAAKVLSIVRALSRQPFFYKLLTSLIEHLPNGPSAEQQQAGHAYVYGEVHGKLKRPIRGILKTPEPYGYTADALIEGTKRWLKNDLPSGFQTPSLAFGANFALEVTPLSEVQIFD